MKHVTVTLCSKVEVFHHRVGMIGSTMLYDGTNKGAGYECVVPLCPGELCTDEHIPESRNHKKKKNMSQIGQKLLFNSE